ncbi:hypothetical protein JCM1840_002290 [Sporobolomyces johnsonii]
MALPPDEALQALRRSYKVAAVSHFAGLFSHHHTEWEHSIDDLEADLAGTRPDCYVPIMLGKLLNTLANDRNTNHTNWLNALRRSYNRRVTSRADNPFYTWVKVPASVVEAERAREREAEAAAWEQEQRDKFGAGEGDEARGIWAQEQRRLEEAEKALYKAHGKGKAKEGSAAASVEPIAAPLPVKAEAAEADMSASTSTAHAVPHTEEALADPFNAELADVIAEDAAQDEQAEQKPTSALEPEAQVAARERFGGAAGDDASGSDPSAKTDGEPKAEEDEEEWWEEQRAVEWNDLSLDTKIDAIYNVCEWHMVDPDRQFRKYLMFDGESAWRLDPIGSDSEGNKYYHLSDDRMWIQRPPPSAAAAAAAGCPPIPQPIKKPHTLLGLRAGPRDKSKKGTVTGTMRFKLKKDLTTGTFQQVDEDDEAEAEADGEDAVMAPPPKTKKDDLLDSEADGPGGATSSNRRASSALTDLDDDEKPSTSALLASEDAKMEDDGAGDLEPSTSAAKPDGRRKRKGQAEPEEEKELAQWEKEYWEERWRAENTPGFYEWEAVCVTLDDWRDFPDRFEGTTDEGEIALAHYAADFVPEYEQLLEDREKEREAELVAMQRKRSSRIAFKESAADEDARLAAEAQQTVDKFTRVTRAKLHVDESGSESGHGATPKGESREERVRKREAEKRAREEAEEQRQLEELREQEREEAREANGGVLPVELMTAEEKKEWERAQDKERKKRDKDGERKAREDAKKQRAKERRAELKLEREAAAREQAEREAADALAAAAPVEVAASDEPWYLDCEICQRAGWNLDDGTEVIGCDQCEEWQHLPCHIQADADAGLDPVPYTAEDYSFICGRCRADPNRRPRPPPPTPIVQPQPVVAVATGTKRKAPAENGRGAKAAAKSQPAAKKAKPAKKATSNGAQGHVPYGHGAHPLYHPSAYQHPNAVQNHSVSPPVGSPAPPPPAARQPPAPAQQQQGGGGGGGAQPQMTYEDLLARVQENPELLGQLPPAYQQHFSEKLGIPLPGGAPAA